MLPPKLPKKKRREGPPRCNAHKAWIRKHRCCVPECVNTPIECAHVRGGGDGSMGVKPSDFRTVSLCWLHHKQQHSMGEERFQAFYGIDMVALADEFAQRSPHRRKTEA